MIFASNDIGKRMKLNERRVWIEWIWMCWVLLENFRKWNSMLQNAAIDERKPIRRRRCEKREPTESSKTVKKCWSTKGCMKIRIWRDVHLCWPALTFGLLCEHCKLHNIHNRLTHHRDSAAGRLFAFVWMLITNYEILCTEFIGRFSALTITQKKWNV